MSWQMYHRPASLDQLARTPFEHHYLGLSRLVVDPETGVFQAYRYNPDTPSGGIAMALVGNLFDHTEAQWRYFVGDENVDALLALRDAIQIYGANGIDLIVQSGPGDAGEIQFTTSGQQGENSAAEIRVHLDDLYGQSEVDPLADQFVSGDTTQSIYNAFTTIVTRDVLFGAAGDDTLLGLLGNDNLDGDAGADHLYGGYGLDILTGGEGDDTLYGEQNADRMFGGAGADFLDGGLGGDYMSGGVGDDIYVVDNPADVVEDKGNPADTDTVLIPTYLSYVLPPNIEDAEMQGLGDSAVSGNAKANAISGNSGDNLIVADKGADVLYGGDGADTIDGGKGADSLTGGSGQDRFVLLRGRDSLTGSADVIVDFQHGVDRIDLSSIDADSSVAGDQAFHLVATLTGVRAQVALVDGMLIGDVNGDGVADFQLNLLGVAVFDATDLVL